MHGGTPQPDTDTGPGATHYVGTEIVPRIWRMYLDLSGKITGILLERENEEILKMIEKPDYLTTNVNNNK